MIDTDLIETDFFNTQNPISDSCTGVIRHYFSELLGMEIQHIESVDFFKSFLEDGTHSIQPFTFSLIGYSVAGLLNRDEKKMVYHDAYGSNLSSSYKRLIKDCLPGYYIETLLQRNQKGGEPSSTVFSILNAYNLYMRETNQGLYQFTSETLREILWDDLADQFIAHAENEPRASEIIEPEVETVSAPVRRSSVCDTYDPLKGLKARQIERKLAMQRKMFQSDGEQS